MTPRKLIAVAVVLLVPGGLVAAGGAWLLRMLGRTRRGQRALQVVRERLPQWPNRKAPLRLRQAA